MGDLRETRFDCIKFVTDFPDSMAKSQIISYMIEHEEAIRWEVNVLCHRGLKITFDGFSTGDAVDDRP